MIEMPEKRFKEGKSLHETNWFACSTEDRIVVAWVCSNDAWRPIELKWSWGSSAWEAFKVSNSFAGSSVLMPFDLKYCLLQEIMQVMKEGGRKECGKPFSFRFWCSCCLVCQTSSLVRKLRKRWCRTMVRFHWVHIKSALQNILEAGHGFFHTH